MRPSVRHLAPTQQAGRYWVLRGLMGEIVMLNLLRLRSVQSFQAFNQHESCFAGIGHRTVAIVDSRPSPLSGQRRRIAT